MEFPWPGLGAAFKLHLSIFKTKTGSVDGISYCDHNSYKKTLSTR